MMEVNMKLRTTLGLLLARSLTGCASEDDTDTDTDTDTDVYPAHNADIQPIWDSKCSNYHPSDSKDGLNLRNAYTKIVDVASDDIPSMSLIEPGDETKSYIWLKLVGSHSAAGGSGAAMPKGTKVVSTAEKDLILEWIKDGAPQ